MWLVSLSLSNSPKPLSLLCVSTFSSLCLLASVKWQNWEMSYPEPKADLIVPEWQQIIYNYLWEVFVSSPLPPSHTSATKGKNSGFSMALYFFSRKLCWIRVLPLLLLLSSPLFLSLPSHWRHLLMPIPGKFQGTVITAASTPKPKKAHEEPVWPDITKTLQWIILSWCLVLVWLPPHFPVAVPAFNLQLSSYLLTWKLLHKAGRNCKLESDVGAESLSGIAVNVGPGIFLQNLWQCWPAQSQVLMGKVNISAGVSIHTAFNLDRRIPCGSIGCLVCSRTLFSRYMENISRYMGSFHYETR